MSEGGRGNPTISISCSGGAKLNRTPSRDSVATDVSLTSCIESRFSLRTTAPMDQKTQNLRVSFRTGNVPLSRGLSPSPCLSDRLAVPSASNRPTSPGVTSIKDIWLDDENDLIRSCGAISKALGLQKSFSTSDIQTNLDNPGDASLRSSRSEAFLQDALCLHWGKLEPNSRSLSTWVAVGDVQSSTSQLPSPQVEMNKGFPESHSIATHFTAADFVRSVNKSVRQNYIKRRLKVTYKAIEQLSESGFDLDKLEKSVKSAPSRILNQNKSKSSKSSKSSIGKIADIPGMTESTAPVSTKEIERDRGKPISKYERNIMIFDWLHTLDETATMEVN